ncbi:GGDEF domain-containing protein [Thiocystis violascens]|uniref:GGDEF domain-containing protein n=1 Tax=Thiocystis violascens TaxID=73141 RepID=UPI00022C3296|nr:GGDEF domain-containing protein [Thiocystis violascens]
MDLFARWGGEEFIVLAPETSLTSAIRLSERLRQSVSAAPIDPVGTVTASFGVASGEERETFEGLIRRADDALYAAKEAGRDQVFPSPESALDQAANAHER